MNHRRVPVAPLFCPADRPDRYAKALDAAEAVIVDLEDAVAAGSKGAAREALAASDLDPARTIVRVNAVGSGELDADLEALRHTPYRMVMLPKTESVADVDRVADYEVIALCESPRGVVNALEIAEHPAVVAMFWGAEDLVAAIGGTSSRLPDGSYRDYARYARGQVLMAAASAGKPCYDAVHLAIDDEDGLRAEATDAAASGFAGTVCIHPRQVPIVRAAFRPSDEQLAWARGVLAAAEGAAGVFRYDDQMIDGPLLMQAEHIVARAV